MNKLTIREHWEVRYKDVDPDTGDISQDKPMALTLDIQHAANIALALNKVEEEPNREYYIRKIGLLKPSNQETNDTMEI